MPSILTRRALRTSKGREPMIRAACVGSRRDRMSAIVCGCSRRRYALMISSLSRATLTHTGSCLPALSASSSSASSSLITWASKSFTSLVEPAKPIPPENMSANSSTSSARSCADSTGSRFAARAISRISSASMRLRSCAAFVRLKASRSTVAFSTPVSGFRSGAAFA